MLKGPTLLRVEGFVERSDMIMYAYKPYNVLMHSYVYIYMNLW
jgi:hypothetical protein